MDTQKGIEENIILLKKRLVEIENRLQYPHHWTEGELDMFKKEIYNKQIKLKELIKTNQSKN